MKLNWGSGIAIFYTLFVVTMVYMVVRASQTDVNMVQDNYYDQDLNYESFRKSRENGLEEGVLSVNYMADRKQVRIHFTDSSEEIVGTVQFYRPSNRGWDKRFDIVVDENYDMQIPVVELPKGYWKILVSWNANGKSYYKEEPLVF